MTNTEEFIERWQEAWRLMDPKRWADIYARDGTLLQPGMDRPITRSEVPAHVRRINSVLPSINCEMKNWASSKNVVFTEWAITAELFGQPLEWEGADRFTIERGKATEEVVHFDTLPLWARLDPRMKRAGLLDGIGQEGSPTDQGRIIAGPGPTCDAPDPRRFMKAYKALWRAADSSHVEEVYHPLWRGKSPTVGGRRIGRNDLFPYCERTKSVLPDYRLDVIRWACRDQVVFIEWSVSGTFSGEAVQWEGIDRHTLCGAQSVDGVTYFDSLPLWARIDPSMKRGFLLGAMTASAQPIGHAS